MIPIKSQEELDKMRLAGGILARVLNKVVLAVKPGIATQELDLIAVDLLKKEGVKAAFKGYNGFPASTCISVNEEIVHGIPNERGLREGDIVSIDLGVELEGYFSDACVTVAVGTISPKLKRLIDVTRKALNEGIKKAKAGNHLFDISAAIQRYVEIQGFSVVRQFVGHGVGKQLHEEPEVPNFGRPKEGPLLQNGMVLAIEPMVNMGGWEALMTANGWTAVTKDGLASAHFEHTVAITESGPEILTK